MTGPCEVGQLIEPRHQGFNFVHFQLWFDEAVFACNESINNSSILKEKNEHRYYLNKSRYKIRKIFLERK